MSASTKWSTIVTDVIAIASFNLKTWKLKNVMNWFLNQIYVICELIFRLRGEWNKYATSFRWTHDNSRSCYQLAPLGLIHAYTEWKALFWLQDSTQQWFPLSIPLSIHWYTIEQINLYFDLIYLMSVHSQCFCRKPVQSIVCHLNDILSEELNQTESNI